jgi:hypothetical protein
MELDKPEESTGARWETGGHKSHEFHSQQASILQGFDLIVFLPVKLFSTSLSSSDESKRQEGRVKREMKLAFGTLTRTRIRA